MVKNEKRKVGRPSLPKNEVKKVTPVRLLDREKNAYEKAAQKAGMSFSEWVRRTLNAAASKLF
jgi:hypothetical protein